MACRISDLRDKQVICVKDGTVLGFVCDVEVNTENGCLASIIVFGRPKLLGLLGREDDIVIPWCEIKVIGPDTVLVGVDPPRPRKNRLNRFRGTLFGGH